MKYLLGSIEIALGLIAITSIAILLIGFGELRAMRSCTSAITTTLQPE